MRHKYISPASPASNPFQLRWIDVANKIPSKLQGCRMRLGLIVCGLKLWIRQNASKIPWYLWTPLQCFLLQSCTADCAYPQRSCTIFSADMKKTEILVTKNGLCTRGRKSLADSSTEKGGLLSASAYKWLHYLLIYVDIYIYIYIIYVIYRDIYIYIYAYIHVICKNCWASFSVRDYFSCPAHLLPGLLSYQIWSSFKIATKNWASMNALNYNLNCERSQDDPGCPIQHHECKAWKIWETGRWKTITSWHLEMV